MDWLMVQDVAFTIRLATLYDIDSLTELHRTSFHPEEHVPMMLGKQYVKATYRWQVSGKRAYTLVTESDGKIVGAIAVCDGPFARPMFKACLGQFILSLIRNPSLIFKKKLWARLFRGSGSSAVASSIANYPGIAQMTIGVVDDEFRGRGIFPALIEATKEVSRSRGSRAIRAGVYKANYSVRRAFIKAGWAEAPMFETDDTMFYMAYLDPDLPTELSLDQENGRKSFLLC